jgi:hypothetical protein
MNEKYFSGQRTGAKFKELKSYRLLLYRKLEPAVPATDPKADFQP